MKRLISLLVSLLISGQIAYSQERQQIKILNYNIEILGNIDPFGLKTSIKKIEDGLAVLTLKLSADNPATPPKFSLKWSTPSNGIHGYWSSASGFNRTIRADWGPSSVSSKLANNAPVMMLLGIDDSNKLTYAVSEAKNTVRLSSSVREEDARIYCQIDFFTEKAQELSEYTVKIRFDARPIKYYNALGNVSNWWADLDGFTPASVPDHARLPMYSTWYSYHQNVEAEALLEECKTAKELGYESIIVDDGWQTMDSNRGYAYTGDWQPERIPKMKQFVEDVHQLDMKFLLWYGVPLVGENSQAYDKFKGKFLKYWQGQGAYFLDPRYPDVRSHIINTYKAALREWQVDGFKLDFLGTLIAYENTVLEIADGRDFASVNEAVDKLMTDIITELRLLNPDIMIEFRQPYIGPLMRKYGNIFRAGDCPNSIIENRLRTTDLKLLSGNTAIHADMLMWQNDEPVELAALQLLNVLYAVPQISVKLNDIPEDHLRMVKYYNNYWRQNRAVLLDGDFKPESPLSNYPILKSSTKDKLIATLYEDRVLNLTSSTPVQIDIINAKLSKAVVLSIKDDLGTYSFEIKNSVGKTINSGSRTLNTGLTSFDIPVSGMVVLTKN